MRRGILSGSLLALACAMFVCAAGAATPSPGSSSRDSRLLGFTSSGAVHEKNLEHQFDAMLSASEMRGWLKQLSSEPNQVGSPHDKANAEFLLKLFRKWGWDAHIEQFDVLYPTPKKELVELVSPTRFKAKLHEPPVQGDPTSKLSGALPPYVIYGADGDVTGQLVYVNYGMPDDYKRLARLGVDVKGKIAIVRYGHGWRGLKPRLAYEHGAIGCLIYSDPSGGGYFSGDMYPKGPERPLEGVQRGSVANQPQYYPGDPTTPGYGSVPGARHISIKDAGPIQKIPVLPISSADAKPLLRALGGPVAPRSWRGAFGFTYHVGAGPAKVHMVVKSDWSYRPVYDVIAKLEGSVESDQWVIRGNHHDGWVFGAWDPLAGTVALMGEAKAMGALYKQGWKPRRTIVYASWDGEEPGLLGSTEWAETHAKELRKKAVLYVNSDTNQRGFLHASGSQSLQRLVNQVAAGVTDPETGTSVDQRMRAHILVGSKGRLSSARARQAAHGGDLPLGALGSGSDYGVFLDHLGIASLSLGFGGEGRSGGVYHSRYDSFAHFARFGDPTFEYEVALARVAGRIVMRTADAKVLPMHFGGLSTALRRYLKELQGHVKELRKDEQRQNRLFAMHAYKLDSDPLHPLIPPLRLSPVPKLEFTALRQSAKRLQQRIRAYERAYQARAQGGLRLPEDRLREVNALIGTLSQRLTDPQGLPGRPWYKNVLFAPGVFTGYGVKIFPAVRQALTARDWNAAEKHAGTVAGTLDQYGKQLDKLTRLLK